jgi:hypothetical protein
MGAVGREHSDDCIDITLLHISFDCGDAHILVPV